MNIISRILGPSITLSCPLVGGPVLLPQIGSEVRNQTGCSDNVWPSSGGMLSFCCLDIDVLPLYMYNKGQ